MNKTKWGQTEDGEDIFTYEIKSASGMIAKLMNYGANLLELYVPDQEGSLTDVVLGYEKVESYFVNDPAFGASVTPVANRIGGAHFTLNGTEYHLDKNDGNNNLHSGFHPLHKRIWDVVDEGDDHICFQIEASDMECGFPGNRTLRVTYTLLSDNTIAIDYYATSDKDTLFAPTNHSYFNLDGHNAGLVTDSYVWINADSITPTDETSVPTGEIRDITDSPMDFRTMKQMSSQIDADYDQLIQGKGYDHNYILLSNKKAPEYSSEASIVYHVAALENPSRTRRMDVYTDMPGLQLYTGNYLNKNEIGKGHFPYDKRYGVAFETQFFPNAANIASFKMPLLKAGESTNSRTVYHFSF